MDIQTGDTFKSIECSMYPNPYRMKIIDVDNDKFRYRSEELGLTKESGWCDIDILRGDIERGRLVKDSQTS